MKKTFGDLIKIRRKRLNMTQSDLARFSGLHRNYVSDVERGCRNISLINIFKLFRVLGLEVEIKEN